MRVIFSIFCFTRNQAKRLEAKIEKIQIKQIVHTSIIKNETNDNLDYKFILNVLTEIKHFNYMFQAIKQKCYDSNIISFCCIRHTLNEPINLEIYEPIIQ